MSASEEDAPLRPIEQCLERLLNLEEDGYAKSRAAATARQVLARAYGDAALAALCTGRPTDQQSELGDGDSDTAKSTADAALQEANELLQSALEEYDQVIELWCEFQASSMAHRAHNAAGVLCLRAAFAEERLYRTMQGFCTDEPAGEREQVCERIRAHLRRAMVHFEARLDMVRTLCSANGERNGHCSNADQTTTNDNDVAKDEAEDEAKDEAKDDKEGDVQSGRAKKGGATDCSATPGILAGLGLHRLDIGFEEADTGGKAATAKLSPQQEQELRMLSVGLFNLALCKDALLRINNTMPDRRKAKTKGKVRSKSKGKQNEMLAHVCDILQAASRTAQRGADLLLAARSENALGAVRFSQGVSGTTAQGVTLGFGCTVGSKLDAEENTSAREHTKAGEDAIEGAKAADTSLLSAGNGVLTAGSISAVAPLRKACACFDRALRFSKLEHARLATRARTRADNAEGTEGEVASEAASEATAEAEIDAVAEDEARRIWQCATISLCACNALLVSAGYDVGGSDESFKDPDAGASNIDNEDSIMSETGRNGQLVQSITTPLTRYRDVSRHDRALRQASAAYAAAASSATYLQLDRFGFSNESCALELTADQSAETNESSKQSTDEVAFMAATSVRRILDVAGLLAPLTRLAPAPSETVGAPASLAQRSGAALLVAHSDVLLAELWLRRAVRRGTGIGIGVASKSDETLALDGAGAYGDAVRQAKAHAQRAIDAIAPALPVDGDANSGGIALAGVSIGDGLKLAASRCAVVAVEARATAAMAAARSLLLESTAASTTLQREDNNDSNAEYSQPTQQDVLRTLLHAHALLGGGWAVGDGKPPSGTAGLGHGLGLDLNLGLGYDTVAVGAHTSADTHLMEKQDDVLQGAIENQSKDVKTKKSKRCRDWLGLWRVRRELATCATLELQLLESRGTDADRKPVVKRGSARKLREKRRRMQKNVLLHLVSAVDAAKIVAEMEAESPASYIGAGTRALISTLVELSWAQLTFGSAVLAIAEEKEQNLSRAEPMGAGKRVPADKSAAALQELERDLASAKSMLQFQWQGAMSAAAVARRAVALSERWLHARETLLGSASPATGDASPHQQAPGFLVVLQSRALRVLGCSQLAARSAAVRAVATLQAASAVRDDINAGGDGRAWVAKAIGGAEAAAAAAAAGVAAALGSTEQDGDTEITKPSMLSVPDRALGLNHEASFALPREALEMLGLSPHFGPLGVKSAEEAGDIAAPAASPPTEDQWVALANNVDNRDRPRAWLAACALKRALRGLLSVRLAATTTAAAAEAADAEASRKDSIGSLASGDWALSDDDADKRDIKTAAETTRAMQNSASTSAAAVAALVPLAELSAVYGDLARANVALAGTPEGYPDPEAEAEQVAQTSGGGVDEKRRKSLLGHSEIASELGDGWAEKVVMDDCEKSRLAEERAAASVTTNAGTSTNLAQGNTGNDKFCSTSVFGAGIPDNMCEGALLARSRAPRRAAAYLHQQIAAMTDVVAAYPHEDIPESTVDDEIQETMPPGSAESVPSSQEVQPSTRYCGAFILAARSAGRAGLAGSGGSKLQLGMQHSQNNDPDPELVQWFEDIASGMGSMARAFSTVGLSTLAALTQRFLGLEKAAIDDMLEVIGINAVSERIMVRNRLLKLCAAA